VLGPCPHAFHLVLMNLVTPVWVYERGKERVDVGVGECMSVYVKDSVNQSV